MDLRESLMAAGMGTGWQEEMLEFVSTPFSEPLALAVRNFLIDNGVEESAITLERESGSSRYSHAICFVKVSDKEGLRKAIPGLVKGEELPETHDPAQGQDGVCMVLTNSSAAEGPV